jgi:hypothetical protein
MRKHIISYRVFEEELIKGGLADYETPEDLAKKHGVNIDQIISQLEKGILVELEHVGNNKAMAKEIAMDHLFEDPIYYDKLEKMEKS